MKRPAETATTLPDRLLGALLRSSAQGLRRLGPIRASNLGGAITRTLGPLLPVSRVAQDNLAAALPELDAAARRRIVRQVWDNLGRTIAEMPLLAQLGLSDQGPGWELIREPAMGAADMSRGAIYFAGHLANWELMMALTRYFHNDFGVLYRAPANPAVDAFVRGLRNDYGGPSMVHFRKGAIGARQTLGHLRAGKVLGLLADQKTNDGIAVPFFGRPAMTAPAVAALALKFRVPLIPAHARRLGPARFRVILEAPLALPDTGDRHRDILEVTTAVNQCLERWIRQEPGDWLWLHRRWPAVAKPGALSLAPAGARDRAPGFESRT
jgi:KDO2-lipid IV(A) lauroyltransferase